MPSRTPLAALAVASTSVSPIFATTEPCDWKASLPVSKDSVLSVPLTGPDMEMASAIYGSSRDGVVLVPWCATAARPVSTCQGPDARVVRLGPGQLEAAPPPQRRSVCCVVDSV